MTRPAASHTQLNRAYVQSKVIEANLHHLAAAFSIGSMASLMASISVGRNGSR